MNFWLIRKKLLNDYFVGSRTFAFLVEYGSDVFDRADRGTFVLHKSDQTLKVMILRPTTTETRRDIITEKFHQ